MAIMDTMRRLAKLGFYFGLGAVAAAFDACGDSSTPGPDGDADAAAEAEAAADADAPEVSQDDGEDLWDTPCE